MPADPSVAAGWRFLRFGVIVTGKGERHFVDRLLRSLTKSGHCAFDVIARVSQLSPRTSPKHTLKMAGSARALPTRDEELGLTARGFVDKGPSTFVIVIDDLEHARRPVRSQVFARYRQALDGLLGDRSWRAAVFFFVNMLEAYYFAHSAAVNAVLGTSLGDCSGDVEEIRQPKNDLKDLVKGFDEIRHGAEIVASLDAEHVLSRAETCAALRALFAWCSRLTGDAPGARYQLANGAYDILTGRQLAQLAGTI